MSNVHAEPEVPQWVRLAVVALAVPTVVAGAWAIISPQGWFDNFPGFNPRLVAAIPPYNEHLATDAGAGLLASGVVLWAAAWQATRPALKVGLIGYAAFTIPHTVWHVFNPADALTGTEDVINALVLVFSVVVCVGLYLAVGRSRPPASTTTGTPKEMETIR